MNTKKERFLILGLILVCFSMRSPMSPVGPLVSDIKGTLLLDSSFAGLLTTIPLVVFALVSPFAGRLANKAGDTRLMPFCLLLSLAGILIRSYLGVAGLMIGTVLIGLGIGVLNVAIPIFIRTNLPGKIGLVMGVYTMAMTLLSALSAGFCVQIAKSVGGWQNSLAVFALFPAAAIPAWLAASQNGLAKQEPVTAPSFLIACRSGKNWCIALFMAFQSTLFFCMIAWMPAMLLEGGVAKENTGMMVLAMQLVSLATNFLMPILMQRWPRRIPLLSMACGVTYAAGLSLLLIGGSPAICLFSAVLLGLASGFSLSFALTMIASRGSDRSETAGISAFAQCVGYALAAPMPVLLGTLRDSLGSFTLPVILLIALCVPMSLSGVLAAPNRS